jgi:ferredoxin
VLRDDERPAGPAPEAAVTARTAQTQLRVDPIACDGRGLCAEMLPELISLDDWGFPIIRPDALPDHLLGDARATIRACPKLALRLERRPWR